MMVCVMFLGVIILWVANLIKQRKSGSNSHSGQIETRKRTRASLDRGAQQAIEGHRAEVERQIVQGTINAAEQAALRAPFQDGR